MHAFFAIKDDELGNGFRTHGKEMGGVPVHLSHQVA
jgi:hypothetical protein